jgi:hypothetical protein
VAPCAAAASSPAAGGEEGAAKAAAEGQRSKFKVDIIIYAAARIIPPFPIETSERALLVRMGII